MEVVLSGFFQKWVAQLRDRRAQTAILARIDRLQIGNLGDTRGLGGGLSELRLAYGPGYRLYFVRRGADLVILLCGGDKDSQSRDIELARKMVAELE